MSLTSLRRRVQWMVRWGLRTILAFVLMSGLAVLSLRWIDPPLWAWKIQRTLFPPDGYPVESAQVWRALDQISPHLKLAVIAAEDQLFAQHSGFDVDAIRAAWSHNQSGRRMRGASTLSQQTAKNLFLWSGRSWLRKALEAWFTLLIELLWDKARILEMYLNIAEFGPGQFGAEAASQAWFGKSSGNLTRSQAARLAAVLPNPYVYKAEPPSPYVARRAAWIERQMRALGRPLLAQIEDR